MNPILALFAALLSLTVSAHAQLIDSFSGGNDLSVGPGTAGYEFTVGVAPLTIRSLGLWDTSGAGLSDLHAVGIWDFTTRTLLASTVVVPATAVGVGGFWYEALSAPLILAAGHTYAIAAQYADVTFDLARGNVPTVVTAGVTLGDAILSSGSGFQFPDLDVSGANAGFFGPNALSTAVPEPGAWSALFAIGLLAFSLVRGFGGPANISVRALLDAKPAERARLQAIVAQKRPAALPAVRDAPSENRPPVTPGTEHGNRPKVPPGKKDYGKP